MVNSEQFGKRLEKIMNTYELTASAFADQIDVGRSSISHILSGRNKPSLDFILKIIDNFPEVELYWLLNGKGSFPKKNAPQAEEVGKKEAPDLFDTDVNINTKKAPIEPADLHQRLSEKSNRQIRRIVVFYTDGTFENFTEVN
jgi:transcriptional regulator with XRE-family HTH domain